LGGFGSAAKHIKEIVTKYKLSVSVSIQAYQIGGDPVQLGGIMSKGKGGDYHIVQCNLDNMGDCISAANGLLDYSQNSFKKQVSFKTGEGVVQLGLDFMKSTPIVKIGLKPPKSLVTREVCRARAELANLLDANQYYLDKLTRLRDQYPVRWDEKSAAYLSLQPLYERAQSNLDLLKSNDPQVGVIGCYDEPEDCVALAARIKERLKPITAADLEPLSNLTQYYYEYTSSNSDEKLLPIYSNGKNYKWNNYPTWKSYKFNSLDITSSSCSVSYMGTHISSGGLSSVKTITSHNWKCDFNSEGICRSSGNSDAVVKHNSTFYIAEYPAPSITDIELDCGKIGDTGTSGEL
jgi:hypothetical protein